MNFKCYAGANAPYERELDEVFGRPIDDVPSHTHTHSHGGYGMHELPPINGHKSPGAGLGGMGGGGGGGGVYDSEDMSPNTRRKKGVMFSDSNIEVSTACVSCVCVYVCTSALLSSLQSVALKARAMNLCGRTHVCVCVCTIQEPIVKKPAKVKTKGARFSDMIDAETPKSNASPIGAFKGQSNGSVYDQSARDVLEDKQSPLLSSFLPKINEWRGKGPEEERQAMLVRGRDTHTHTHTYAHTHAGTLRLLSVCCVAVARWPKSVLGRVGLSLCLNLKCGCRALRGPAAPTSRLGAGMGL